MQTSSTTIQIDHRLPARGGRSEEGFTTRPRVRGKFLFLGNEKFHVKGVTYGTFRPDADGSQFPDLETIERDFAVMAEGGINAIRTYTVPTLKILDLAMSYGLRVMVGIPWEQHVTFLDDRSRAKSIEERVRMAVRSCAKHPAVLCYTIGNEIPSSIVRWHGRPEIEKFLLRLYAIAKSEDPAFCLVWAKISTERLPIDRNRQYIT